jgi:hypothetical protein
LKRARSYFQKVTEFLRKPAGKMLEKLTPGINPIVEIFCFEAD